MKTPGTFKQEFAEMEKKIHLLGREMDTLENHLASRRRLGKISEAQQKKITREIEELNLQRRQLLMKQREYGKLLPEWWE